MQHPEGVAFAFGCMFVQTNWGRVVRLSQRGGSSWQIQDEPPHEIGPVVSWGLCHHGDSLYSAVDNHYESTLYTAPPGGPATGGVVRLIMDADGRILSSAVFTKVKSSKTAFLFRHSVGKPSKAKVRRPSGVRFDSGGRLWVTSMEVSSGLLCFSGPESETPGEGIAEENEKK